jgi:hypothetical protein
MSIKQLIEPNEENLVYMLKLENCNIVHLGGYCLYPHGMAKILCTFCLAWRRYEPVDGYVMRSKNGTTLNSGYICKSLICAEKYKEDIKKYIQNAAYLQKLLNAAERLQLLTFAAACHKETSVPSSKFCNILRMKNTHISSFLSTDMDSNDYTYNYAKVNRDAEKYRERCEALMQKKNT